jgi:MFS transporter, DHA1 family, multidrug resistance protein
LHRGRANFRVVAVALFATSMGLMVFLPVLSLYVGERFSIDDPRELAFQGSIIYGAAPLSAAIAGPLWGALGDRFGKKAMAIRANLAIALTTALMPFAPTPLVLLLMRVLQGVLAGYVAPAMALVTMDMPARIHGRVIGKLQVAMALGSLVGPMLGAEFTHWCGRSSLFWLTSGLAALAALALHLGAVEATAPTTQRAANFGRDFAASLRTLFGNPVFAGLLALVLLLRLGQNMLEPLLALFVQELGPEPLLVAVSRTAELALDRTIAIAFGVLAVAQWFCTVWWGRQGDRHGPLRCLGCLSLGLAVALALTALVTGIREFLLLRIAVACLMAGSMTLAYSAASKRVPAQNRTLAFALVQSCIQFGLALGPALGAWIAADGERVDFRRVLWAAALLCGLAGIGMLWLRRSSAAGPGGASVAAGREPV